MKINDEEIYEFMRLYAEEFDKPLSFEEARRIAKDLVALLSLLEGHESDEEPESP